MSEWVVQALLTVDRVIEERNGKKSLIGVFDHFNLPSFPSVGLPPWYIYASMSNLSAGTHQCVVNIVSDESHAVLLFGERLSCEVRAPVPTLPDHSVRATIYKLRPHRALSDGVRPDGRR